MRCVKFCTKTDGTHTYAARIRHCFKLKSKNLGRLRTLWLSLQAPPDDVTEMFSLTQSFRSHYDPGVDSASNKNEYQEYFLGVKAAGA